MDQFEKRIDRGMEGLGALTVFALILILGGMAAMKWLQFGELLIGAYMLLSSAAFIALFGLGVWQVRRLAHRSSEAVGIAQTDTDVHEIAPAATQPALKASPSIIEHTTRDLLGMQRDRVKD